jgi:hypothetical protein
MTTNSDFDRHAAAFMADGPTELSDRMLEAALREVHVTHQRRRLAPWRTTLMPTAFRLAAAVAIVALVVGAGALVTKNVAGPSSTPPGATSPVATATVTPSNATAPIDTTAWSTFVSKRYGLSFGVPPTWTVEPAHRSGPGIAADEADAPGAVALFSANSGPFPQGLDESAGWAAYEATLGSGPTACDPHAPNAFSTMLIDGHFAHVFDVRAACGYGRAVLFTGGRIYVLTAIPMGRGGTIDAIDHSLFMAWLSTVRIDPAAADDSITNSLDTSLWATFDTRVYGYDALRPVDWVESPATRAASMQDLTDGDESVLDILDMGDGERLVGFSMPVPAGTTQDEWLAAYRDAVGGRRGPGCIPLRSRWETVPVGSATGGLYSGCSIVEAISFVGDRVYSFHIELPAGTQIQDEQRTLLRLFLSTIRFRSADALAPGVTAIPQ